MWLLSGRIWGEFQQVHCTDWGNTSWDLTRASRHNDHFKKRDTDWYREKSSVALRSRQTNAIESFPLIFEDNTLKIAPRRFQIISLEVSSLTNTLFSFEVNWFNSSVALRCFFQNFNPSFRHTTVLSERWWYRSSVKAFLNLLKEHLRASLEFNHLPIDLSRCCYRTTSNVQWKLLPLKELFLKSWQQAFLRLNDLSNARSLSNFQILIQETIELWTSRV